MPPAAPFAGMEALEDPYMEVGFLRMLKKRAGWLMALFIGEMLTASALGRFEGEIERVELDTTWFRGNAPGSCAIKPDGSTLYVVYAANSDSDGWVVPVNTANNTATATTLVPARVVRQTKKVVCDKFTVTPKSLRC